MASACAECGSERGTDTAWLRHHFVDRYDPSKPVEYDFCSGEHMAVFVNRLADEREG